MAHRKWKEIKLQPSMLLGPAVPGCSLFSFHFRWAILCPQAVDGFAGKCVTEWNRTMALLEGENNALLMLSKSCSRETAEPLNAKRAQKNIHPEHLLRHIGKAGMVRRSSSRRWEGSRDISSGL